MTQPRRILIVGATSAIAEATARLWAAEGANLYLLARSAGKLELVSRDLTLRGALVRGALLDADHFATHAQSVDAAFEAWSGLDVALIAHGELPDQAACEQDAGLAVRSLTTNALSVVSLVTLIAQRMAAQRSGHIVVIGSVAGDRGRKSNYVYGAGKALVATFLEGFAGRLHESGVHVVNIKPGLVDTPMTAAFKKGVMWAKPETVARIIQRRAAAAKSGGFYAPGFWAPIMWVIRALPARLLYRLNL